jgi:hypothetical protein
VDLAAGRVVEEVTRLRSIAPGWSGGG